MSSDSSVIIVLSESHQDNKTNKVDQQRKPSVTQTSQKKVRAIKSGPSSRAIIQEAKDDGQKPRNSHLTKATDHGQVSLQGIEFANQNKGSVEVDPTVSVGKPLAKTKKRKAGDDGEAPQKKAMFRRRTNTVDLKITAVFNNVSPEEEKIFEMASSGNTSQSDFREKYIELLPIGAGGFGSVFSGFRRDDNFPVAIKHIQGKDVMVETVVCNGNVYTISVEVALMLKSAGLPGSGAESAAVSLLDWYLLNGELVLVMERPPLSKDLFSYLKGQGASLEEHEAKVILRQLVDAAVDMHSKGVFHRDIKSKNVLLELGLEQPKVRIIDFGCGTFSTNEDYTRFCGTRSYFPPEWSEFRTYSAHSTTVWQLGAVFYSLLHRRKRFSTTAFINKDISICSALSSDCKDLLNMCLARDPKDRATLEELQLCTALRQI